MHNKERRRKNYLDNKEKQLAQGATWRRDNKARHNELSRAFYHRDKQDNPVKYMLKWAKRRAKLKEIEFNLSLEDIVIPTLCPIFKVKLEGRHAPSIDRIDSNKGYTKDNIQIISSLANRMKWDASHEELIQFAKGVLQHDA